MWSERPALNLSGMKGRQPRSGHAILWPDAMSNQ
jgi:hypothetical protein